MKKKNDLLIFTCMLGLLFWGCPKADTTVVTLDKEFLSYFAFPKGSWWVYKEVNTAKRDSIYVVASVIQVVGPRPLGYKHEEMGIDMKTSDSVRHYSVIPFPKEGYVRNSLQENCVCGLGSTSYNRLYYPLNAKYKDEQYIVQNIDSMKLQDGRLYFNILSVVKDSTTNQDPYIRSEYYAKGVGLIRREYWSGEIWELEKYEIK